MTEGQYGFTIGQRVEARIADSYSNESHEWRPAVVTSFYTHDLRPIEVNFDDGRNSGWYCKVEHVRAIAAPQAMRWEFRTRADVHSTWRDWAPVTTGPVSRIGADQIEFREAPVRTDAEILVKAREVADRIYAAHSDIRKALRGEF